MHPGLQPPEGGHPVDERDDLAVEQRVTDVRGLSDELRVPRADVVPGPADEADATLGNVQQGADSVPLELVGPALAGRQTGNRSGEHRVHAPNLGACVRSGRAAFRSAW